MTIVLLIVIILAGFYMAWNIGANDVANAMGTSVGSGALTLRHAVIVAAILEFSGAYFFGSHVSSTMQHGIIDPDHFITRPMTLVYGMLATLLASGIWLNIASYRGWPVSTTHSIVGAIVGFGAIVGGYEAVHWRNVGFIVSSWILSPIFGGLIAFYLFTFIRKRILYTPQPVDSARKLAPLFALLVVSVLSLIFVFDAFQNLTLGYSLTQKILFTFGLCLPVLGIIYFLVKKIVKKPQQLKNVPIFDPVIVSSLDKAKKHLAKVNATSAGDVKYTVSVLIEEIERLSNSLQEKQEVHTSHDEYLKVEKIFGYLQIMSASMMAFAHGANDVANAIGPLSAAVAILTTGLYAVESPVPTWALALGGVGIVIGLATWGWRVIETIGKKITELTPSRGFAAEFGAAATIAFASRLGMPISTTHTLVGAVLGVGFGRGLEAVNLNTIRDILISWIVTVPMGALIAIILYYPINFIFS